MIVLDTNVVSEAIRPGGNPVVRTWLDRQRRHELYLTATGLSEMLLGIRLLPDGRRRSTLDRLVAEGVETIFETRILPFDRRAAAEYAYIVSRARSMGRTIKLADGQIAAIAMVHGFTVATRDTAPFHAAGVAVIDPWTA